MEVIRRLTAYYRNDLKLSSKLLISHLALILVSTVTIVVFFGSSIYHVLIQMTIDSKQQTAFSTAASINAQLEQIMDSTEAIASAYYRFTANRYIIGERTEQEYGAAYFTDTIRQYTDPAMDVVYQLYLGPDRLDLLREEQLAPYVQSLDPVRETEWFAIVTAEPGLDSLFCPGAYLSPAETAAYGDLAYVHVLPGSIDFNIEGYIVAYFSREPLIDTLVQNLNISRGASYVLNSRNVPVCDSDPNGMYLEYRQLLESGSGLSQADSDIVVGSSAIHSAGWKVVSILPKADALREADRAVTQFFGIYGVVALLSAILAVILARSISGRITSVVRQMGQVHDSRPEKITSLPPSRDEVGQLVSSYNHMTDALNSLMDKQAESARTLRLSEFKALQAQINPHFLYNSLDMINWLAKAGALDQVSDAIQALGRFYKLTLSKKDTFGTVGKEVEHASLYVKLQNMRYENRIEFVVDIDERLLDCAMPKLIFQPLVENAILHGIMERSDRRGEILLAGWQDGADLVFLLSDNGVGMDPAQLERILHPEAAEMDPAGSSSHIGVYNTNARLQLYYGPQYGLTYQSSPGAGTEVQIRLPASRGLA